MRVVQALGLGFLFVPISLAGYVGISPEKSNSIAGLLNFMRNIGSSVGTSMMTTMLARRAQFHQSMLAYRTTSYDPAFLDQIRGLSQQLVQSGSSTADAQIQAYRRVYLSLQAQAQTLAYLDTFMVLAVGAGLMFLLAFVVRTNDPSAGGEVAAG